MCVRLTQELTQELTYYGSYHFKYVFKSNLRRGDAARAAPKGGGSALVSVCLWRACAVPLPSCSQCLSEDLLRACHPHLRSKRLACVFCADAQIQWHACNECPVHVQWCNLNTTRHLSPRMRAHHCGTLACIDNGPHVSNGTRLHPRFANRCTTSVDLISMSGPAATSNSLAV